MTTSSDTVRAIAEVISEARAAHTSPVETDDGLVERCSCGAWPPIRVALSVDGPWLWLFEHQRLAMAHAVLTCGLVIAVPQDTQEPLPFDDAEPAKEPVRP